MQSVDGNMNAPALAPPLLAPVPMTSAPRAARWSRRHRILLVTAYAAAGVTWWIEGIGEWRGDVDAMAAFIQGGPPGR